MANVTILDQMSTGDVIDRSVRLYRRNFTPLVLIVAVPSLIGYFVQVTLLIGYTQFLGSIENSPTNPMDESSMALIMMGLAGYPVWFFALLFTISGLSRVVGDHIMLGEAITFRKCFSAAKKRFGDIFIMGLLALVAAFVLYVVFVIVAVIAILVLGLLTGIVISAQMPRWLVATVMTIVALVILAAAIFIVLYVLARIVFMPQIIMLEGYKAGHAIGRAIKLGGGNWHRVGAIVLFVYFVSLSVLAAFMVPTSIILYFFGLLSTDFFVSPTWNVISTSFSQLSNLLVLPLWVVSFTLLYFDNRVRKEGYDLELLAREVSPGFYWEPVPSPVQYPPSVVPARPTVQTSPLGLSGYGPLPTEPVITQTVVNEGRAAPPENGHPSGIPIPYPSSSYTESEMSDRNTGSETEIPTPVDALLPAQVPISQVKTCRNCGRPLQPRARFCILCGAGAKDAV